MPWGSFLVMMAMLVGAAPAAAQVRPPDSVPYPTTEPTAAPRAKRPAVRQQAAPKRAAKPAPKAAQKPAPKAADKPAATAKVPLPVPAPRAKIAKLDAAKPAPPKLASADPTVKIAKIEPAKAAPPQKIEPPKAAAGPAPFAGIPPRDRLKIQQQLFWAGDYNNDGKGEETAVAAIKSFQKRNKAKVTGELTGDQRADLVAAAERHEREFGWSVVIDPATGIRIGLPKKLVPEAHEAPHGTRWSAPHGDVHVETFRLKSTTLAKLYEHEKKHPKTRKISNASLTDDGFIISGMQGLKYFSMRAKARDGEVRGFTLLFDQMMDGIMAPVTVAMASAFAPFPERTLALADLSKKVEYGTGLIVSPQAHIVTARKMAQGCQVIVADGLGNAEHVADDEDNGLALLRVYGAGKVPVVALANEAPQPGDMTLVGIPDPKEQGGAKRLSEIKARLTARQAIELREPVPMAGFAGAAAVDAEGKLLGVMETRSFVLASAEPSIPPVRLVTAKTIRDFLAKHDVAAADSGTARAATVRIICVRK
jgi:hypothetical protein